MPMKLKSIYSRKVAILLQEQGFPIVKIGINPYNTNQKVFFFEDTSEFNQAFELAMKGWSKR